MQRSSSVFSRPLQSHQATGQAVSALLAKLRADSARHLLLCAVSAWCSSRPRASTVDLTLPPARCNYSTLCASRTPQQQAPFLTCPAVAAVSPAAANALMPQVGCLAPARIASRASARRCALTLIRRRRSVHAVNGRVTHAMRSCRYGREFPSSSQPSTTSAWLHSLRWHAPGAQSAGSATITRTIRPGIVRLHRHRP